MSDTTSAIYIIQASVCYGTFLLFLWYAIYMFMTTKRNVVWYCKQCGTCLEVNTIPNGCPSCHGNTDKFEQRSARLTPSAIYVLVMMLFLAEAYAVQTAYIARSLMDTDIHSTFLKSFRWETRNLFKFIIEILILWRMILKIYFSFFNNYSSNKRSGI